MKNNTVQQFEITPLSTTEIFAACLRLPSDVFSLDQPCDFDENGAASCAIAEDEWAVSYKAEFIGTIYLEGGAWHITPAREHFTCEMEAARALLALEAIDGHVTL